MLFGILISQSALAKVLTIEEAISMALLNSAEIQVAKADLSAQRNKQISSWLNLGPRLSASYNHMFYDGPIQVNLGGKDILLRDDVVKSGSLVLTQPITPIFALAQRGR